jgi:hypothetical protein
MIARFDEVSGRWRVVGHDGSVIEEFATSAETWKWFDDHSEADQAVRRDRISNAIRQW